MAQLDHERCDDDDIHIRYYYMHIAIQAWRNCVWDHIYLLDDTSFGELVPILVTLVHGYLGNNILTKIEDEFNEKIIEVKKETMRPQRDWF